MKTGFRPTVRQTLFVLTILFLAYPIQTVSSLDYIKSVREMPIKQGYEIILNYDVDKKDIRAVFIDDETNIRTHAEIKEYYKMPDGTVKVKTDYVDANRIAFHYADTYDDWNLRGINAFCDAFELQEMNTPDCLNERGYPLSFRNV